MPTKIDAKLVDELRDRWAMAREHLALPMPLIIGEECYEFFGEWVKIVEVHIYGTTESAEVLIETRGMQQRRVEFSELNWRPNYRLNDAACRKTRAEVITGGSGDADDD